MGKFKLKFIQSSNIYTSGPGLSYSTVPPYLQPRNDGLVLVAREPRPTIFHELLLPWMLFFCCDLLVRQLSLWLHFILCYCYQHRTIGIICPLLGCPCEFD